MQAENLIANVIPTEGEQTPGASVGSARESPLSRAFLKLTFRLSLPRVQTDEVAHSHGAFNAEADPHTSSSQIEQDVSAVPACPSPAQSC